MFDHLLTHTILGTIVVLLPVLLVVILGCTSLFNRQLSESATARLVAITTGLGLIAALGVFFIMLLNGTRHVVVEFGNWVHIENAEPEPSYHFAVKFLFDRLSVPFVALTYVLFGTIGAFAHRYMHRERGYNRFFALYAIFLAGMVIASLADTIETMFIGWELVGLSSALLVAFFQDRPAPVRNALRIWVVYRISDAALLLAAVFLHHMSGEGDLDRLMGYREVDGVEFAAWPHGECALAADEMLIVGVLMLIAAAGKSALVPFSGWLPRAMEGPTPSSAVFYGALSVHLGVFWLLRLDPLIDASPLLSTLVIILGLTTALFAALTARVQTDIKAALSFASLTQVGLIVAEIGIGWRYIPLVHLLGHACLRTLQFVRAPSVIRDHSTIENAIGMRVPRISAGWRGSIGAWWYRFAVERGYLDAFLDRFIVGPFVRLFRWFDRMEGRATRAIRGTAHETVVSQADTNGEVRG